MEQRWVAKRETFLAKATAEDWLAEGMDLMKDKGFGSLTLENLCGRMKKTRGSFYHHFQDMNAYVGRLLHHWQALQTQAAIDRTEQETDPKARLAVLDETVRGLDHRLDQIIRAWSLRDPRAADAMASVDRTRVAYLRKLFLDNGVSEDMATVLAELEYTAFLGAQQRFDDMKSPEAKRLAECLRDVLHVYAKSKS